MIRNGMRGLGGVNQDMVAAASGISASMIQDNTFPFWWQIPHAQDQWRQKMVWIPAPNPGILTVVDEFVVPAGFFFVMRGIRQNFRAPTGSNPWVEGSGDILWSITADIPSGSQPLNGYALPDMNNMPEERGAASRYWPIDSYAVFDPYVTLSYKVLTTSNIPAGSPNFIGAGMFGYFHKVNG